MNANEDEDDWTDEDHRNLAAQAMRRAARLRFCSSLESRLGIPDGFIIKLDTEADDWSYIVKLAVLCEAAITHALVSAATNDEKRTIWYEHFSNLSNSKRLDLTLKLGIISREVKDQLDAVAQFRNSFAHEVNNLGGSLSIFLKQRSLDKKIELANKLLGIKHTKDQDWKFYIANTRLLIGVGTLSAIKALASVGLSIKEIADLERRWMLADLYKIVPNSDRL